MKFRLSLLGISLLFSVFSFAQTGFKKEVQRFLDRDELQPANVGISVIDINSGTPIFQLNADKLFVPASTLKLVTTASALELLGEDYRFETRIGYIGKIKNGILEGDLILIGGGDPALGSAFFSKHYSGFLENWVEKIKQHGIARIKGDLVLDVSLYDPERIPATWIWEDIGNYYGAGANALTFHDNLFRIVLRSPKRAGKETRIVRISPPMKNLKFVNEVRSSDINRDLAYVFGSPYDKQRILRGTIPRNRKAFTIKAAMPEPCNVLAEAFQQKMAERGVFITGKVNYGQVSNGVFNEIYVQESPSLKEIIKLVNYKSNNLFAEHLLKQIAAEKTGTGSRTVGIEIIEDHWQKRGLNTDDLLMEDGSGLSPFNAVTPTFYTSLLSEMKDIESFVLSLPGAGEGTIASFDTTVFPNRTLIAKSGSMKRVRCYGGYLSTNAGDKLAFAIMVNQFTGEHSSLIFEIKRLLKEMAGIN